MNFYNNNIKRFFLLAPFLEPIMFYSFNFIDYIYLGWKFVSILLIFVCLLFSKSIFKLSAPTYLFIFYRIILVISSILNGTDVIYAVTNSVITIFFLISFELSAKVNKMETIKFLRNLLLVYLFINLLSYPIINSLTSSRDSVIYFLGIRTRFTDVCVPAMLLAIYYDIKTFGKLSKCSIVSIILSAFNIFIAWVGTGIIGMAIIILGIFLSNSNGFKKFICSYKALFLSLFFNFGVVFLRIQNYFSYIIVNILHKSLTLSSRTYVWDLSIDKIMNKPVLGYGINESGVFVNLWGYDLQTLNQFLQVLAEGGFIALIIFLLILFVPYRKQKKNKIYSKELYYIFLFLFAFSIMMLSERYANYIYFYIPILLDFIEIKSIQKRNV